MDTDYQGMGFLKIAHGFSRGFFCARTTKSRQGRQNGSFVPDGTVYFAGTVNPTLKGWAIFGTQSRERLTGTLAPPLFSICVSSVKICGQDKIPRILDCGGKRSATPLCERVPFLSGRIISAKAPSPLRFAGAVQIDLSSVHPWLK
jgi:hypothetical protein